MKKRISILVLILFLLSFLMFDMPVFALTGDINGDGKVDDEDTAMYGYYLSGDSKLSDEEWAIIEKNVKANGDLNKDGKYDQDDASEIISIIQHGHTLTPDVDSCIGFEDPDGCNLGIALDGSRYGCAWNDKYNFCSPNGLAYLACGEGDTDAHDIPQFLPRITSYAIAILKTVTPVILIIMSMVQIIKAIASQNEDEMKKAKSALVKKLIAATLIFFVTTIVQFVIKKAADGSEFASVNNCLSCFINNDCNGSLYFVDGYGNCYDVDSKSQVDCDTDIGVKPRGWVEAVDGSSSDDSESEE